MDPALQELARRGRPDDEVAVILRLHDPATAPAAARVVARFGDVATARITRAAIAAVWADAAVRSVKAPHPYTPDVELPPAEDDPAPPPDPSRPAGLRWTGRGVVVGLADWGIDVGHPDLRHPDGRTRLRALWDQRPAEAGRAEPYGYGRILDAATIDAALRTADPYATLGHDPADFDAGNGSHGTHTAGVACGNGRGGGPVGLAPEAELAFVSLGRQPATGAAPLGDSVELLEALAFLVDVAAGSPCVINLSLGRHAGGHTGHALLELAMDSLVSATPGLAVVQSCGNYYRRRTHASWQLRPGDVQEFRVEVDPDDRTPNEVDLWYPGPDRMTVTVTAVGPQPEQATVPPGGRGTIRVGGDEVGRVYHRAGPDPNNGDHQISIYLEPSPAVEGWEIALRADDVVDGRVHAWIERDGGCRDCQSRFPADTADPRVTLGSIATGYRTLTVGAYDPRDPRRPPAWFSSSGPTRDGRRKPDLVAPGVLVLGPRSRPRGAAPGARYVRMSGTSMAAPAVAGCVALLFEAAGRPLSIAESRRAVLAGCDPPAPDGDVQRLGSGYLSVERVLGAISVPPAPSDPEVVMTHERHACTPAGVRVAVVGGGFAGLTAAWALQDGGFRVGLFEATGRLGGRVRTDTGLVPGKVVEAGAELIGENHPTWWTLARTFGLSLEKVGRPAAARVRLGTRNLTGRQLAEVERELTRVMGVIGGEARAVSAVAPWTTADAARLDAMSVADRLDRADLFGPASSIPRRLFDFVTENDQCAPPGAQSYLGLLAAVSAHAHRGDPLGYWRKTETHRCRGGNEQLAAHLAKSLRDVRLNTAVTVVELGSGSTRVGFVRDGTAGSETFDYVVLATPPQVWPRVDANPPFRPAELTMGAGPAVKFLGAVDTRFWERVGLAPNALWDRLGSVWEGTDHQDRPRRGFCLSVYSGGGFVLDPATYVERMDELYPGYRAALTGRQLVDWPNEPWIRTGYSIPAPGQVTTIARRLSRSVGGRLFLAGEQASPGFFGYMEGALQSGLRAAGQVALAARAACAGRHGTGEHEAAEDAVHALADVITGSSPTGSGTVPGARSSVHPAGRPAVLVLGAVHPAVRDAQVLLNARVPSGRPALLKEDGVFGPATRTAVLAFQREVFPVTPGRHDGRIDAETWMQLDALPDTPEVLEVRPPGRGEASAFDRRGELIDRMNAQSGGTAYRLDGRTIRYEVRDEARVTPFDRRMQQLIDLAEMIPMRLIDRTGHVGGGPLAFDALQGGYVDLDDLLASSDLAFQLLMVHFLTERAQIRDYARRIGTLDIPAVYPSAHRAGRRAEAEHLRDVVGDPTIDHVYDEPRPGGNYVVGFRSRGEKYWVFRVNADTATRGVRASSLFVQLPDRSRLTVEQLVARRARAGGPAETVKGATGVGPLGTEAGPGYDRSGALAYARKFWLRPCDDRFIALGDGVVAVPAGTVFAHEFEADGITSARRERAVLPDGSHIPWARLEDCTHFISCCIGQRPGESCGGIPITFKQMGEPPRGPYGIVRVSSMVDYLLGRSGFRTRHATLVAERSADDRMIGRLEPGDLIAYFHLGRRTYTHLAMLLDDGRIACHTYARSDQPGCTWDNAWDLGRTTHRWTFLHLTG